MRVLCKESEGVGRCWISHSEYVAYGEISGTRFSLSTLVKVT